MSGIVFDQGGATVTLSGTTTSSNAAISAGLSNSIVAVRNSGAVTVFVKFGNDNTVAATTSDTAISAGETVYLAKGQEQDYVAVRTASSTATVYATPGDAILGVGNIEMTGTSGSVIFIGSGGSEAQDNAAFFWDAVNKRLGLGGSTPAARLDVRTTGTGVILLGDWGGGANYGALSFNGSLAAGSCNFYSSPLLRWSKQLMSIKAWSSCAISLYR